MPVTAEDIKNYTSFTEREYNKLQGKIHQTQKALDDNNIVEAKIFLAEVNNQINNLADSAEELHQKTHYEILPTDENNIGWNE